MKKKSTLVVVFALACAGVMIASGCKSSKQEASELVSGHGFPGRKYGLRRAVCELA